MNDIEYGQKRLKGMVQKEAEEKAKGQQQDDDEQNDTVPKIKLLFEGIYVKQYRVSGNVNGANTRIIMAKLTPHIEMRTKVIYLCKSEIYQGAGEIVDYSKTLT